MTMLLASTAMQQWSIIIMNIVLIAAIISIALVTTLSHYRCHHLWHWHYHCQYHSHRKEVDEQDGVNPVEWRSYY
jgi:hypothetical protein